MVLNGLPYSDINNDIYLRCFLFSSSHTLLFYNLHRYLGFHIKGRVGCMPANQFSHVWLFVILWAVAHQAPFSMGFSRQEYWCGFPCHSSRDPPNPGIESCVCRIAIASFTTDHQESPKLCVQFSSVQSLSHVWPFATPWIAARQASLSTTNSRSSLRLTVGLQHSRKQERNPK